MHRGKAEYHSIGLIFSMARRIPRLKKRAFVLFAVIIVIIATIAGFALHILPPVQNLGHYIEPKAAAASPPLMEKAAASLAQLMSPPLIADFANAPDSDYSPLTIRFLDLSRGTPSHWQWDFGDGMSSADQHPVHTYRQPGVYNATLTVTRNDGSRRVAGRDDVLDALSPAGEVVRLDTLHQGFVKKGSFVTFLSAGAGSFCAVDGAQRPLPAGSVAKLRVNTDDTGTMTVRQGNLLRFGFTDATLFVNGTQVAQGASGDCSLPSLRYFHADLTYSVTPAEGAIRQLVAGGTAIRAGADNSRILIRQDSADHNADLTLVTSPAFFEGLATNFTLSPAISANFDISAAEGEAPLNVTFSDRSSGSPESWAWDFGDGAHSSDQNPEHRYVSPGSYMVSLTVARGDQTDMKKFPNAIVALPARLRADFNASPLTGPLPLKVSFTDLSAGSPTQWSWGLFTNDTYFTGNGQMAVLHERNPVYTFTEPGTYSVWLAVGSIYGTSEVTKPRFITVTDPYRFPDTGLLIETGKKGVITKGSSVRFTVGDTPAMISVNGGYRDLPKGSLVLIEALRDQEGEIYMDKGQLLKFSFPDMAVFINGEMIGGGSIDSIFVPHPADFRTALTYYFPPESAYTRVVMNNYDVLGDLESAWIRVQNLGMDQNGNLRLTSSDNRTYLSGAANRTVHDWIVE